MRDSAHSWPGPFAWIVILYLGSLVVLLVSAFWQLDPFTQEIVHEPTLKNFQTIVEVPVYRTIAIRTITMAAAVTIACAVLAFPIAYYMARHRVEADAPPARSSRS